MKNSGFRNGKLKAIQTKYILLILSALCAFSILISLVFNIGGGPLSAIAGYIFVPMQKGINASGGWIFDTANEFRSLSDALKEIEELKDKNEELTAQLSDTKLDQYELESLRDLYELDEKYSSFEKIAAGVVAKDSGNWFSSFTIDKGSNDGIEVGMNVIAGSGLAGIVTEVSPNFSKVRSIIDDSSNVSAMIPTTGDNFNVRGDIQSMNESSVITFIELRDYDNKAKVGDAVVTSYVSDKFHQGILIGYVASIEFGPNNMTKIGTIKPAVDFEHLEYVFVIKNVKAIEDPEVKE